MTTLERQAAIAGDIFATPENLIVRVTRVGRAGWVDVRVVGGARDGYGQRMRHGIPMDWARYPR